jgi:hypothetical protein
MSSSGEGAQRPAGFRLVGGKRGTVASADERRRFVRLVCDAEITLVEVDAQRRPGAEHHGFGRDVSQGGVGLITAKPVPVGSEVVVQFRAGTRGPLPPMFGRVANCTLKESGWWFVGVAFMRMPAVLIDAPWVNGNGN